MRMYLIVDLISYVFIIEILDNVCVRNREIYIDS